MADPGRVLGVGVATRDIVNVVAAYPPEDAEMRAVAQRVARGGNTANTLSVLRDLGRPCAFAGTLADDAGAAFIAADLAGRGIDIAGATRVPGAATPTSYITLSQATGSRTIVHHRDLPELTAAAFARVSLDGFDWVHFEGRNPAETIAMIARVHGERPDLPVSIEIEKPRPGIDALLRRPAGTAPSAPRVLILARAYVVSTAGDEADPGDFLRSMATTCDADLLLLPWGADGAHALIPGGAVIHAPAHRPAAVIDSIAAGDVFNAAVIDGLLAGLDPPALLARANRLAGFGCGMHGLDGIVAGARAAGLL